MDSYDDILRRMKLKYRSLAGFLPSDESDIMLRLKVLAGEIYNMAVANEYVKQQMFAQTASSQYLDSHAQQRGLYRKDAEKAIGVVTFSTEEAAVSDIVIEEGTVVSTAQEEPLQFVTKYAATIKAGSNSAVVQAQAASAGRKYNVRPKTVSVLVTPVAGITKVTNESAFAGGVDKENDEDLRKRVLDSYRDISNSTNEIYYKRLVESLPSVYSSSVLSNARGAGTLDIYMSGKGNTPIGIKDLEKAQELVDENRELNVDAIVFNALPKQVKVTVGIDVEDGYSFEQMKELVTQKITEYVESLGVAKPFLLSDVGDIIYHTVGIRNYMFYDSFCSDVFVQGFEYCVINQIDVREWV